MKLSQRMSRLGTETAFDVLARAKALQAQGADVISGSPNTPVQGLAAEGKGGGGREGGRAGGPRPAVRPVGRVYFFSAKKFTKMF